MKPYLDPRVKLRGDGGRAVVFSVNPADEDDDGVFRFLHPRQAIILSLFDGTRAVSEIRRLAGYLFGIDQETAAAQIEALLNLPVGGNQTIASLLVDTPADGSRPLRRYDPFQFVVPSDQVDMRNVRCKVPQKILILPTMRCATSCIYCYADTAGMRGRKEFGVPLFRRLLGEVRECGIETVEFSGGDLLCRPDCLELIGAVFDEGLYPNIPTKTPISRSTADRLVSLGLKTIQVSIDAYTPRTIDRLVRRTGYGERILKSIDHLGEAGIQVRTNTVLTPINVDEVPALLSFLAERAFVIKSNVTCYGRSLYRHDDALFLTSDAVHRFERELKKITSLHPDKKITFSGPNQDYYAGTREERIRSYRKRAFCTANRRGPVVLPDGQVTVCEELYFHPDFIIGDLNRNSLLEIWNSEAAAALAAPVQKNVPDGACRECPDYSECHGTYGRCYREALKAYGYDKPHWPDPRCPYAPRGRSFTAS